MGAVYDRKPDAAPDRLLAEHPAPAAEIVVFQSREDGKSLIRLPARVQCVGQGLLQRSTQAAATTCFVCQTIAWSRS